MDIEVGSQVKWAGVQNPWCAPGWNGTVLAIARNDQDSLKVSWVERGDQYTWERRKNLALSKDGLAGVVAVVS